MTRVVFQATSAQKLGGSGLDERKPSTGSSSKKADRFALLSRSFLTYYKSSVTGPPPRCIPEKFTPNAQNQKILFYQKVLYQLLKLTNQEKVIVHRHREIYTTRGHTQERSNTSWGLFCLALSIFFLYHFTVALDSVGWGQVLDVYVASVLILEIYLAASLPNCLCKYG